MIALALMSMGLAAALAFALVALAARIRESAGMEVHPAWKSRLLESGLASAGAILSLPGLSVSGHAFRHVRRVVLDPATGRRAYLKVEQRVRWKDRVRSWLDGLGLASLSLREARILRMLENEGLPGPGWIAFGSDGAGRSFLLIPESPAVELGVFIAEDRVPWRRRRAAIRLGRALARMHASGVNHPDLYAKHVLVDPETGEPTLLDWQRSRRAPVVSFNARLRDLATLQATISGQLVSDDLRGALLRSYLRESRRKAGCLWGGFSRPCREPYDPGDFTREERHWLRHPELERLAASRIETITGQMLAKRHVREKRQATSRAPGLDWTASPDGDLIVSSAWLEAGLDPESPARRRLAGALEGQSAAAVSVLQPLDLGDNHLALLSARISSGRSGVSPWRSAEKRVANLWNRLHKHAVPGPRVLAVGRKTLADGREASYLVLEPRPALASLADWLATSAAGPADRQSVLSGAGAVLARLHAAGCRLSRDPHPLGVALEDGSPVVVVRPWGVRPPSRLAKFAIRTDLGLLSRELAAAGTNPDELDWIQAGYFDEMGHNRALPRHVGPDDARGGVFMGYRDDSPGPAPAFQAIGDGRASIWRRWFQGIWHGVQASSWTRFAGQDWHRSIMDRDLRDRYHTKQGRSIARWSLPDPQGGPNLVVYVKRHHVLPWWQGLLACLLPRGRWSPALQEWQHLDWANRQGVPVPRPVAASEYLAPGGKLSSCLIIEELSGMLPTHEAIPKASRSLAPRAFRRFKRGLAREMARLTRLLHDRSCFHKDLYLCHFYIHEADIARPPEDWRGKVFMIDLHRLGRHPLTAPLWQLKDLAQLAYSSEVEGVEPIDRVAFWRAYRRPGTSSWWTRWLMRAVLVKWRRYRAHNLKHRGKRPGADRKAA